MCDQHPKALYFQNCFVDGSYLHIPKNRHVNLESWRNDGLAGASRAFTSLKESNTGLLPASSSCRHLVSSEFPKSWDGWSPPGDWMSCVLVKSTATLTQQLHWLVCLQATWKVKDHSRCWDTALFRWTHFGAAMVSTADGRAHLHQDSRSWGPAQICGTNSSHRTLLPSTLSRRNSGLFFFFLLFSQNS